MKHRPSAFALGALLTLLGAVAHADEKAEQLLKEVQQTTGALKTLSAELVSNQESGEVKANGTGKIRLKRPNFLYVETGKPFNYINASDGKNVYLAILESKQFMKNEVSADGSNAAMASLLTLLLLNPDIPKTLGRMFPKMEGPTLQGEETREGVAYQVVNYLFKPQDGVSVKISLFISPQKLIAGMKQAVEQKQGKSQFSEFLKNVKLDEEMPDASFAYTPPKDFKPYEEPKFDANLLPTGKEAPAFELTDPKTKKRISLAKALDKRKAVLVNFWFYN